MDTSLQPVFDQTNDYISNYTNGNIDLNQRLRAINRAIEEVHRKLGLTCDEVIFTFPYIQDNMYTDLPSDYDEPIILTYQNKNYNIGGQAGWNWRQYTQILQNTGVGGQGGWGNNYALNTYSQKWFSSTNINGLKQLMQVGANVIQGGIINPYNTSNLTTATGDATNLAVDNNIWINTGGSLSFTIDPTLGFGYAGILTTGFGIMTVEQAIQNSGVYKVYSYLQSLDISEIQLILTSATGTFTFSADTQDDSTAFTLQEWFKTQFQWGDVQISGSPNSQEITSYEFRYVEGPGFGSTPIDYFRIDDFYLVYPDIMELVYYTQIKGTNAAGTVQKIILDELTDKPTFMQFFPDFINMIALRAARILMPQLSADKEFMEMYRQDYVNEMKSLGKIYPRKRIVNLSQTFLRRP